MPENLTVRKFEPDEWPLYRQLRLRALAESPNAFGTTLRQAQQRTDDDWAARVSSGGLSPSDLPLLGSVGGVPSGMTWAKLGTATHEPAQLLQMWVAPEARGRGLAAALVTFVLDWLRSVGAAQLYLQVTCGDTPARRLYECMGFQPVGDPAPLREGSEIVVQPMLLHLGESTPEPRSLKIGPE